MKTCSKCKVERPFEDFFKEKRNSDGLMSHCRFCRAEAKRQLREKSPKFWIKERYKITAEQFDAMLAAQGGVCLICHRGAEKWDIDHDHSCCPGRQSCGACVRGILCHPCNTKLGWYESNRDRLTAYLAK